MALTGIKEFFVQDLGAAVLWDFVKKFARVGAHQVAQNAAGEAEKIIEKSLEEHRGELLAFIMSLEDQEASQALLQRQKDRQARVLRPYPPAGQPAGTLGIPYGHLDEIHFVQWLTKLFKALDDPSEKKTRERVFIQLGHMTPQEFDETLPFLEHDIVLRWLKQLGTGIEDVYNWLKQNGPSVETIQNALAQVSALPGQADEHVATEIHRFQSWLDERTRVPGVNLRRARTRVEYRPDGSTVINVVSAGRRISVGALVGLGFLLASLIYAVYVGLSALL